MRSVGGRRRRRQLFVRAENSFDKFQAGELGNKYSHRQSKMPSRQNAGGSKRDWGKGLATAGRSKTCTIVPKNHFGPIPGIDVGMCWKFRIQVSEEGGD